MYWPFGQPVEREYLSAVGMAGQHQFIVKRSQVVNQGGVVRQQDTEIIAAAAFKRTLKVNTEGRVSHGGSSIGNSGDEDVGVANH